MDTHRRRLDRLELIFKRPGCPSCWRLAESVRLVDDAGNESRPTHGPSCGLDLAPPPPLTATLRICGVALADI